MFLSFVIKISCLILSKALLMSRHTTAVTLVWSIARKIASVEDINEVSVACHLLFPLWLDASLCFSVIYNVSWSSAIFSHAFDRIGKSEIGLLLLTTLWSPSFGIGHTSAVSQTLGKTPQLNELFIIEVINGMITGANSFMTRDGTLSVPGALLLASDFTTLSTSQYATSPNVNCSERWYCIRTNDACDKPAAILKLAFAPSIRTSSWNRTGLHSTTEQRNSTAEQRNNKTELHNGSTG